MTLLEMKGMRKSFYNVEVLHGVDFNLHRGEVHALIGENGAGKSTLMKLLMGEYVPDGGEIRIDGEPVRFSSPADALRRGVSKVHQELSPIRDMTVAENLFLGRESNRWGFVKGKNQEARARTLFDKLSLAIDPGLPMRKLSVSQTQMVEIAKAVSFESKILILDEPTSAITSIEVERLYSTIRLLREQGVGIIYISHKLEELYEISDRITVLRDGSFVCTNKTESLPRQRLIHAMVGRELTDLYPKTDNRIGEPVMRVEGYTQKGRFRNVSFTLHSGEILGLAGLMGSGRTELCMALFGAERVDSGTMWLGDKAVRIRWPSDAINRKIALIPEDRKHQGLNLQASVQDNMIAVVQRRYSKYGFLRFKKAKRSTEDMVDKLQIKVHSTAQPVTNLSGGNQQKVVVGKWRLTDPDIIIFDEPTRGVDVGAKAEIYKIINDFAHQGKAVLMVSSEMPELIGMCDRVLVLRQGIIAGELSGEEIQQHKIMELATG